MHKANECIHSCTTLPFRLPPPFEHYRFEQFVHLRIHSHSFNSCKNQQWLANFSLHSNRRHTHTHSTQHTHSITLTHTLALTLIHWRTAPHIMEHGITNNECSQQVSNFFEWVTPGYSLFHSPKTAKTGEKRVEQKLSACCANFQSFSTYTHSIVHFPSAYYGVPQHVLNRICMNQENTCLEFITQ